MQTRLLGNTGESLSVVGFGAIVFVNEGPCPSCARPWPAPSTRG